MGQLPRMMSFGDDTAPGAKVAVTPKPLMLPPAGLITAVPEREVGHSHLHTKPSETARVAREAGCSTLVLTHFMPEIDAERESAVATVREQFHGTVLVAHDLMTIPVDHQTG